jgi:hypothetical protein
MESSRNAAVLRRFSGPLVGLATLGLLVVAAHAAGPLAAKVNVTSLAGYSGASSLPKPEKILVYDFDLNPGDVQVDKVQAMRPRHLLTGDKSQDAVAAGAGKTYYQELVKALGKTGIPVEHVAAGTPAPPNALVIQGSFDALKEGTKAERVAVGLGTGSADVETKVNVHLKTPTDNVTFLQFQTNTKPAENVGAGLPVVAGLNPAAAAAKSTVGDRKKTLNAYASKTAEASAKEILKSMAAQGWVKINDKGEVAD